MHLNVALESDWISVVDEVAAKFGKLDILVNNAGISTERGASHDPEHATLEDWQKVHRINLDGTFLGCKHAIRVMRKTGQGSIINMSSRSGLFGQPAIAAYASSKAGVRNHTKSVALYCAGQNLNIRCNSIHPGAILTPIWEPALHTSEYEKKIESISRSVPLHRVGKPEEVAALAMFLASDEAPFMTGAEFNIDGGILAGSAASPT